MALFPPGEPFFIQTRDQPRWQRWFMNSIALLFGAALMIFGVYVTFHCSYAFLRNSSVRSGALGATAPHRQAWEVFLGGSLVWLIGVVYAGLAAWDVVQLLRNDSSTPTGQPDGPQ